MVFNPKEQAHKLTIIDAQLEILRQRETEFQRIIDEMQVLQASIRHEREELEIEREEIDHMRIPIYRVPAEILIQVFMLVIRSEFEEQRLLGRKSPLWTPFAISHVCRPWYKVATSTPEIWSFVSLCGTIHQPGLQEQFRRSKASPLHIFYRVSLDILKKGDIQQMEDVAAELEEQFYRIRTFDFQSYTLYAMRVCLANLRKFIRAATVPTIETLSLILINESSTDFGVDSAYDKEKPGPSNTSQCSCTVRSLKISHIIPFCLSPDIFVQLTRLELSYAPKKSPLNTPHLPMSALSRFLSHTPLLEDLVIFDTIPVFDITRAGAGVPLLRLRTLDWSNPQVRDVMKLMAFLNTPSLVKLDLWLDGSSQPIFSSSPPLLAPLDYPCLKELNLQCMGDSDSVKYVFGKFLFPALEKMELANFAPGSMSNVDEDPHLSPLPALTDIFRDPRLSNLTHLTLCSWNITPDVRTFLGYLPTLTSLTLEKCLNVGMLIRSLQELVLVQFMLKSVPYQRRDVKVCPRLEAMTLWGCNDVKFACLRTLALARNGHIEPPHRSVVTQKANRPNGVPASTSTSGQVPGNGGGGEVSITRGRVILPLRKSRCQGQSSPSAHLETPQGTSSVLLDAIPVVDVTRSTKNVSQHAHILYLRIEKCRLIGQMETESLRSLGVLDVIWS
ncbi:hypothetical protein P691DRAFT_724088 [Macrolepiota fuliginosa MF-IS2]|uniref:F-box domain-containing protein n=1 Tax=Macrolepiota fuliginosa MF-IS2 TaxID=1400762 RepID=A0A9P5XIE1_9AGAR|nr:hypothetical protein P691DRAFT_724088 [Macrolepiota fuliginosa MF-IS2]